jgi:tetratricopeptide (TPR) repeat protein
MKRFVMIMLAVTGVNAMANAQQIRTYTNSEEDSTACVQNLSLYIEYFKQENYPDALIGWRKAIKICPRSTESLWINGVKIYQELIDKESDDAKKEALIDTLAWVYDQRIEYFGRKDGKEGYILGRKGSDILKYRKDDPKQAYAMLRKSLELQGNDMEAGASIYLYKAAYDMYRNKEADKALLFELYDVLGSAVEYNIANQTDARMKGAFETAQVNIDKMFSTVAECPDLIEIYTPKFQANPSDERLLRQILKTFDKRDCTSEELYQKAAVALYAIDPSATAAYAIANGDPKKDNYSKALEFYTNAMNQAEDDELKAKAITQAAKTSLILGNYMKAKSLANDLLRLNPNNGEAYIIIGDAYAKGRSECGTNECESRAAYWAAVDKYYQAKSVDPSVAETAQSRINTYSAQFPKKEDCFFHGINEGTTYTFNCWIGETTTVRTR